MFANQEKERPCWLIRGEDRRAEGEGGSVIGECVR